MYEYKILILVCVKNLKKSPLWKVFAYRKEYKLLFDMRTETTSPYIPITPAIMTGSVSLNIPSGRMMPVETMPPDAFAVP